MIKKHHIESTSTTEIFLARCHMHVYSLIKYNHRSVVQKNTNPMHALNIKKKLATGKFKKQN